jgi:alkanesulfonate monooxygenase SsuD/methylene tetrahydromethanopterin reductase-like flavin-dependent oxidoreductase (luciferase family)
MQHHSTGVMNPAHARARYREAHELLIAAMTQPGPFEWDGEYFQIPYVNLWPRPIQDPHPPIFVPGGGSKETLELVAKHRYTYQAVLSPRPALLKTYAKFRELCEEQGYTASPKQLAAVIEVHVAETDAQARREVEAHTLWQYQNFFRSPMHDNFPPGYTSAQSLAAMSQGGYRSRPMNEYTFDDVVENGWVIAGSPETVASKLQESLEESGAGRVLLGMNSGTKPRWMTMKSMTMFAEEVIPRLRPGGRPLWADQQPAGWRTASEFGARRPTDFPVPSVAGIVPDSLANVETAHIDELRTPIEPWPAG